MNNTDNISAKTVVFLILTLVVIVGISYFVNNNLNLFGKFPVSKNQEIPPPGTPIINLMQLNADAKLSKQNFVVPKSKVSLAYYDAFNNTLNEVIIIDGANKNLLAPLISNIKNGLETKSYNDFPSLSSQIKNINDAQKNRQAILSGHLSLLSSINKKTVDQKTKDLTNNLIDAVTNLNDSYKTYSKIIDDSIGEKIDEQTIASAKLLEDKILSATTASRKASTEILLYFSEVIKADLKNYSAPASGKK